VHPLFRQKGAPALNNSRGTLSVRDFGVRNSILCHVDRKVLGLNIQRQFSWNELQLKPPKRNPRSAFLKGFSLHADTHVHGNDRPGLVKLCRYGARGPLALERLSRRDDGKFIYQMKKRKADGSTELVLSGMELLQKLVALIPPPSTNLSKYFGVFAPGAKYRAAVVPTPASTVTPTVPHPSAARSTGQTPALKCPALDWAALLRRTFDIDVFDCPCGGRRRLLAFINKPAAAKAILNHLGLPAQVPKFPRAHGPPRQMQLVP